ncbi:hypothetical protein CFBP4996_26565 (plasmid) [Agrobacterium leguminum]|uniref:hypothetical protein n=1 Tax=Agrobacterium leguminum TaxID=2792015 RepID=UPI0010C9CA58|nr:hypothetical protein [Agrobacterium leguminum]WFS69558.1 hypothetical protein CFBP4996_26565 [Agrobacterium leguminum]
MPINEIIAEIEAQIASRPTNKFGIKVGSELYKELAKAGKVQWKTFTMEGTGLFPIDLPAYMHGNWGYATTVDWEMGDYDYKVGVPDQDNDR